MRGRGQRALAQLALDCKGALDGLKIRDWMLNPDQINQMKDALDGVLYTFSRERGVPLASAELDLLIEGVISAAQHQELGEA